MLALVIMVRVLGVLRVWLKNCSPSLEIKGLNICRIINGSYSRIWGLIPAALQSHTVLLPMKFPECVEKLKEEWKKK